LTWLWKERKDVSPIKIAILDTGYDRESHFFTDECRAKRIVWRDFSGSSEKPEDEDGHGTHVLSLVMKVAPAAHLYVARIAKDSASLRKDGEKTTENVKKVTSFCFSS
jgi:subtilisin family serine protease